MGQRRARFRVTRRGKITIAILLTSLVSVAAISLHTNPMGVLGSSNPKSTDTNPAVLGQAQGEGKVDRVNFHDSNMTSIIATYKPDKRSNTPIINTSPEIDEEFFQKALFIGDSITEGISAYGLLEDRNILAVKGLTVLKAEKEIDTIVKRKPERIYILLGSNDLLYGMDSEKFSSEYIEFIQHIKDKLPNTKVYIQSIFPVSKDVEANKPLLSNSRIDEFNRKLKSMAEQQEINYINVSDLLKDNSGIMNKDYTSDGIHVKYKFYSIWLDCVKRNS